MATTDDVAYEARIIHNYWLVMVNFCLITLWVSSSVSLMSLTLVFLFLDGDNCFNCIIIVTLNTLQVPFQVPLEVNIVLVGLNGDGGYRYAVDSHKLEEFLRTGFPSYRPLCLETGEPLDIEHLVVYNAFPVSFSQQLHFIYFI